MGRGRAITDAEVAEIKVLHSEEFSMSEIAARIKRSRKAIYNVLASERRGGLRKSRDSNRKMTETAMRAVLRKDATDLYTAPKLRSIFNLPLG